MPKNMHEALIVKLALEFITKDVSNLQLQILSGTIKMMISMLIKC